MEDNRPRVKPPGQVNLAQLDAELGHPGLCRNEETGEVVANGNITQGELEAAVAAHSPNPTPDPDTEFRAAVQSAVTLADLKAALLGSRGPGAQARRR